MGSMFRSLSEKVANLLTLQSQVSTPIRKDLEKLCRMTERIGALLDDAEEREIRERTVKQWLDELRDLAYDAEDVIEEFEYELLRNQLESKKEQKGTKRKLKPIVSKIKKINDRFDEIYQLKLALKLGKEDGQRHRTELLEPPVMMQSSSLVDQGGVSGREEDKQKMIDMLLSDGSHCNEGIRVVSIVGMGGLGKTTLAQLVYNDALVESHFEIKSWVCVSEPFDVTSITKAILEYIERKRSELEELSPLQESLRKKLEGKRFLLVLDDVWNENIRHWEALRVSFLSGAKGSRVLITTRSEKVSGISGAGEGNMYRLGCLSEEDSWLLFEKRAFSEKNSSDYPNLVKIGRQIVDRCKGLPLTLKTLAGLLYCEFSEESWEDILSSELWELAEGKDQILPALKLSYHHLPALIKPCFAYCAVFPKGHRFDRDELVLLWMAQGHINPTSRLCMEDVGRRYFEDLVQRSFIQMVRLSWAKKNQFNFVMHDLIHDLARSIWDGECCELEAGKLPTEKARHLRFQGKEDECLVTPLPTDQLRRLRTFYMPCYWDSEIKIDIDVVLSMKHLRVLILYGVKREKLPDSIGNLKHLRYLDIGGMNICTSLPESLGNLLNLQTLIVRNGRSFEVLPESTVFLVNLRYLYVPCFELQMMPCGFGRLTQLRSLPVFVVGEGSGAAGIEELTGLNDLQGSLIIRFRSVTRKKENKNSDDRVAEAAILSNKKGLESLTVDFDALGALNEESGRASMGQQEEELIERLRPHTNLKHLKIRNYCGGRFAKWLGDPSYSKLESIDLIHCGNYRHVPALGRLPSLKHLTLQGMTTAGEFFHNGMVVDRTSFFPSLQTLRLDNLPNCEGISVGTEEAGTFPTLGELIILRCYKLRYIKLRHLTALTELEIRGCEELIELDYYDDVNVYLACESSSSSGLEQQQQDRSMVDHMPCIHTMKLVDCPKLNFQPAQQQLPRSLRRLDVSDSLLVDKWVTSHVDKLFGLDSVDGTVTQLRHAEKAWEMVLSFKYSNKNVELRWDPEQRQQAPSSSSPEEDEGVLKKLGAPHGLNELVIQGYRGRRFPSTWLADPDVLSNLVKITLSSCIHCQHLIPLLGRLPALDTLEFYDMPEWEEWPEFQEDDRAFLRLGVLKITNCPKLRTLQLTASPQTPLESESMDTVGRDPVSGSDLSERACFGDLSDLYISSLPCLQSVSFAKISTLREIYIRNCPELISLNNLHHHSTLRSIKLLDCPRLEFLLDKQLPNIINVDGIYRFGPEPVDLCHAVDLSFRELIMQGYQDRSFPNWVGNYYASFSNVVTVIISNCIRCDCLPPLGQLPSLERLYISKMDQIRRVGREFCGGGRGGFPSLRILEFCDMREWEEWLEFQEDDGAFPKLWFLDIKNCPKLRTLQLTASLQTSLESESMDTVGRDVVSGSDLSEPACYGALCNLYISSLPCLQSVSFAKISTLREICINNCSELVSLNNLHHHSTLQNIDILDCPRVEILLDKQLPNIINVTIDGIYRFGPEHVDLCHAIDPSFRELIIQGYQDRSFPNWVGNYYASFSNVVKVTISNCIPCDHFPPLGQLPSLEHLYISKMDQIRRVGREFCGGGRGGFPSLRILEFCDMREWEEWLEFQQDDGAFPKLWFLDIKNCPKLRTLQLTASPRTPLESESMDTVGRDAVSGSDLSEPAGYGALSNLHISSLPCLPSVSFAKISTLIEICINNCPELVSLNNLHHHSTLQNIDILDCPRVEILLDKQLPNIINVTVNGIYRFGPELVDLCHAVDPSFRELIIQGYQDRSFPDWVGNYYASFSDVKKVIISNCILCDRFPPLGQLPSLERLYISKMDQIRRVGREFYGGDHGAFLRLETLVFCDMPEWEEWQVADCAFPKLRDLRIYNCPKLRTLQLITPLLTPASEQPCFPFLSKLHICGLPSLKSVSFTNLSKLSGLLINDCLELVSVNGLHCLSSLQQTLRIYNCPKLGNLQLTAPPLLTSASESSSSGSLSELHISGLPSLKSVSFPNHSTLRELRISECPELVSVHGLHGISSLETLFLVGCPRLKYPLDEQLPSTLKYVNINDINVLFAPN